MKSLILIILYSFAPLICNSEETANVSDGFSIILEVTESERSKDSWSMDYQISVEDGLLKFSSESGGHRPPEGKTYVSELSPEQVTEIKKVIEDNNLLRSDTTLNSRGPVGMYFYCNLVIMMDGEEYNIIISGAENYFEDEELVQGVKNLLEALKRIN